MAHKPPVPRSSGCLDMSGPWGFTRPRNRVKRSMIPQTSTNQKPCLAWSSQALTIGESRTPSPTHQKPNPHLTHSTSAHAWAFGRGNTSIGGLLFGTLHAVDQSHIWSLRLKHCKTRFTQPGRIEQGGIPRKRNNNSTPKKTHTKLLYFE